MRNRRASITHVIDIVKPLTPTLSRQRIARVAEAMTKARAE